MPPRGRDVRHATFTSEEQSVTSTEPTTDDGLAPEDVAVETIDTPTAASVQAADVTFADFDVRPEIVAALADAGITTPFPIQAMTLPVALSGHDIIGQAKTGTGKTLGFGVPLLHRVVAPDEEGFDALPAPGKPQALVVVPTRELAVQVAGDLETASKRRSVRIALLYGGRAYEPQIDMLQRGVEVVVGTPGRMIDLMNQGHLDLSRVKCVVLDEADEMLDLGFLPDVEKLLARTPASRHTMLFSATMPGAVVAMARRYMTQPTHIRASEPDDIGQTVKNIKQVVYRAHALDKVEVLARILQSEGRGLTIVFARTKRTAAKVADDLVERGFAAGALHGDLGQGAREQALRAFRNGKVDVLVATDVAARGIDVDDVTHVVNYQCPEDEKTYLHRTGRTGRAGNKGTAVTFVDWDDVPRWGLINKALELGFPEPQETYSSSPHLYTDLNIPAGTTGRLPRSKRTREGLGAEVLEDLGETGKRHSSGRETGRDGGSRDGGRGSRDGGPRDGGRGEHGDGGRQRNRRHGSGERPAEATEGSTGPAEGTSGSTGPAEGRTEDGGAPRRRRNRRRTRGGGSSAEGASEQPTSTEG
ncbi:DEAD/DEAH box helicase [Cellulomonas hominis]|uniref:DEAD/DEAH box helicase n=1 Tax=Cellulomonas hominis TaxID=156981 RepID=UPI001B9FDB98|nr:DEAD/DEAH box helicase [Cellulomonas hominis]VTR76501.1 DEAD-box ATP-dependent RNA helicase CshA [Cellulomonas hominis]